MKTCLLVLALLASTWSLHPAWAESPPSFQAGMSRTEVRDPVIGKEMTVFFWYPTTAPARDFAAGPFVMRVAVGAPVAEGRHGLIVISHGAGGNALGHRDIALALARDGWLVAAPNHPGDTTFDQGGTPGAIWAGRPRQVSLVIDAVAKNSRLGPHLDVQRIGIVGHSRGGYTALAVLGARPDLSRIVMHCQEHPEDKGFCEYGQRSGHPERIGTEPIKVTPDLRVKAAVLLAPLVVPFAPEELAKVRVPVRLYAAEDDTVLQSRYNADVLRAALGHLVEFVLVPNAGHYSFLAPFPAALRGQVGEAGQDPPGFDRAAFHRRLDAEVVAFFDRVLQ